MVNYKLSFNGLLTILVEKLCDGEVGQNFVNGPNVLSESATGFSDVESSTRTVSVGMDTSCNFQRFMTRGFVLVKTNQRNRIEG